MLCQRETYSGLPQRAAYVSGDCPSEPGLQVGNCFKIYHTKLNYGDVDE